MYVAISGLAFIKATELWLRWKNGSCITSYALDRYVGRESQAIRGLLCGYISFKVGLILGVYGRIRLSSHVRRGVTEKAGRTRLRTRLKSHARTIRIGKVNVSHGGM